MRSIPIIGMVSVFIVTQSFADDSPPASMARMKIECANVDEKVIKQIHDFAFSLSEGNVLRGGVAKNVRQWAKDGNIIVSDTCLIEIVRLAYKEGQEQKLRNRITRSERDRQQKEASIEREKQEKEASAERDKTTKWEGLTEIEKQWVITRDLYREYYFNIFSSKYPLSEKEIRENSLKLTIPVLECGFIKVGRIGALFSVVVTDITSNSSAIVNLRCSDKKDLDDPDHISLWISGIDTSKLTTESKWKLNQTFKVVGTKTYSTVMGGSRTIFDVQLLPIDISKLKHIVIPKDVKISSE